VGRSIKKGRSRRGWKNLPFESLTQTFQEVQSYFFFFATFFFAFFATFFLAFFFAIAVITSFQISLNNDLLQISFHNSIVIIVISSSIASKILHGFFLNPAFPKRLNLRHDFSSIGIICGFSVEKDKKDVWRKAKYCFHSLYNARIRESAFFLSKRRR
jgi:hypothetical protein